MVSDYGIDVPTARPDIFAPTEVRCSHGTEVVLVAERPRQLGHPEDAPTRFTVCVFRFDADRNLTWSKAGATDLFGHLDEPATASRMAREAQQYVEMHR